MENKMAWIACRWCQVKLYFDSKPGWYNCECKAVGLDLGVGYYRILAHFEDFELGGK